MNSDTNLAAWMIAGGQLTATAAAEREREHRIAIAAAQEAPAGRSITARISAAFASFRAPRIEADPACCPA